MNYLFLKIDMGLYEFSIDHDTTYSLNSPSSLFFCLPPIERYGYGLNTH